MQAGVQRITDILPTKEDMQAGVKKITDVLPTNIQTTANDVKKSFDEALRKVSILPSRSSTKHELKYSIDPVFRSSTNEWLWSLAVIKHGESLESLESNEKFTLLFKENNIRAFVYHS